MSKKEVSHIETALHAGSFDKHTFGVSFDWDLSSILQTEMCTFVSRCW